MKMISPLKDKPLRTPGQSVDEEMQEILTDKLFEYLLFPMLFWLFAGIELLAQWRHMPRIPGWYAAAATLFTVWGGWKILPLKKRIRAMKLGRDGERAVGQFLEELRKDGARVFHDIPGDNFNLDHVVITDRGIFVVETKTHSKPSSDARVTLVNGELRVAGHKLDRDPIQQVQAQISWLTRTLEESTGKRFPVLGALVFPSWFVDPALKNAFENIWVLEPKALPAFINHEPVRIRQEDVMLASYHLSRYVRTN
jgi:hypothetical protein